MCERIEKLEKRVKILEDLLYDVWSMLRDEGKLTDTNAWDILEAIKQE